MKNIWWISIWKEIWRSIDDGHMPSPIPYSNQSMDTLDEIHAKLGVACKTRSKCISDLLRWAGIMDHIIWQAGYSILLSSLFLCFNDELDTNSAPPPSSWFIGRLVHVITQHATLSFKKLYPNKKFLENDTLIGAILFCFICGWYSTS